MVNMLHYDSVHATNCATTVATPELVGTVTLLPETSDVPFVHLQDVNNGVSTTAEAQALEWQINFRSLAEDVWTTSGCMGSGGKPATQHCNNQPHGKFIPFAPRPSEMLGNARISFYTMPLNPDPTCDFSAQAFTGFTVGSIDYSFLNNRGGSNFGALKSRIAWADCEEEPDFGNAVAEIFPNTITIPYWVGKVCAFGAMYVYDAVQDTAEDVLGYVDVSGTVQGLDPMHIPYPATDAPLLGALVDSTQQYGELISPAFIELPKADVTITLTGNLQTALAANTDQLTFNMYGVR